MIKFKVTKLFFDKPAILKAIDRAAIRVLSKFGAFIRTAAKSSIRKRKKVSPPGFPPSSHEGSLKRLIFFSYDKEKKSVVIGPVPFGAKGGQVPELLEYGGTRRIPKGTLVVVDAGVGRGKGGRFISGKQFVESDGRTVKYEPRSFMGPALKQEAPKFAGLWANAIKK